MIAFMCHQTVQRKLRIEVYIMYGIHTDSLRSDAICDYLRSFYVVGTYISYGVRNSTILYFPRTSAK